MEQKKRKPIRLRVQRIVMGISIAALLVACGVGLASMLKIRSISEQSLKNNTEQNLENLVQSKAELAEEVEKLLLTLSKNEFIIVSVLDYNLDTDIDAE